MIKFYRTLDNLGKGHNRRVHVRKQSRDICLTPESHNYIQSMWHQYKSWFIYQIIATVLVLKPIVLQSMLYHQDIPKHNCHRNVISSIIWPQQRNVSTYHMSKQYGKRNWFCLQSCSKLEAINLPVTALSPMLTALWNTINMESKLTKQGLFVIAAGGSVFLSRVFV